MFEVIKLAAVSAALAAALVVATEPRTASSAPKGDRVVPRIEVDREGASATPGAHRPVRIITLTKAELKPKAALAEVVPA